ncbi:MAG TPA: Calx-beta domain-containing protein [Patescibacteria group bacterium]|nr:Calx-beta domain-containing protein [Patescibacteria group bacterium]
MNLRRLCLSAFAIAFAHPASAADLSADIVDRAMRTEVGAFIELPMPETPAALISMPVKMRRIDVVAPGTKTHVIDADGVHELPESGWRHFIADASEPGAPRYGLSISPDGREAFGVLLGGDGRYSIRSRKAGGSLTLEAIARPTTDAEGNPIFFACELDAHTGLDLSKQVGLPSRDDVHAVLDAAGVPKATTAASRSATVAIDTDTELLTLKFGGSTANATVYLDQLFLGMNLIYERDLDVTLLRGTTLLRTASDPYGTTSASSTIDQLDEFGEEWVANQNAVSRAFAAQISGKSASNNSSAGVAWLIGADNMCTEKGFTFNSGICSDGQCTAGHYSISRVFKFNGSDGADDVMVVAHELGHNFGVNHTHCTSATTGNEPVATGTIDQCYNGEAGSGCYGGTATCPAAQTINGVTNVRGTLMSYCHITPASCGTSEVFHPRNVINLDAVADANVTSGCFTTGGGGTIAIADRTSGEATTPMQFTLTRSTSTGTASVVATTATTGSATGGGTDFSNVSSQTVNFTAGSTAATLNVTINNDNIDELDETFVVNLTTPSAGYTISDAQATGTITDDDTTTITVNDPAAVTEGSPITFTVTLSNPNSRTVTVSRATANGTATSGDYTGLGAATLTFTSGGALTQNVVVNSTDDGLDEPGAAETFSLNLSNPNTGASGAVLGGAGTDIGTGSINDNDPTPTIRIADAPIQPENGINPTRFVVTLSNPSQPSISVTASTANGTATLADNDYQQRSQALTFTSGNTSIDFDVTRFGDTQFEADETLAVNLTNPTAGYSIADAAAIGTIGNDDPGPAVSIADASLTENAANMVFTVSIPAAAGANASVTYGTAPIDATPGVDYTAVTGTATINAGATSTTINVPVLGDAIDEWDEQFIVNIAATSSSTLSDGQAVGTIIDNDAGGDPIFRNGFD